MRSGNPVLKNTPFAQPGAADTYASSISGAKLDAMDHAAQKADVMTVRGTAMKTMYLLLIAVVTAACSWNYFLNNQGAIIATCIGSIIASLVTGLIIHRVPKTAHFVVPLFAFAEGMFLAAFTLLVVKYSGLADRIAPPLPDGSVSPEAFAVIGQAAGLTFAIAAATLLGYATGLIRLSGFAMKMIVVMTVGVGIYYMLGWVVNMFAGDVIPRMGWEGGAFGIGFSLFVVILASFNLLMDFQLIDEGVKRGAPKYYEWIGAFGLLVTLVWLYIELLRLLMKLRSSD